MDTETNVYQLPVRKTTAMTEVTRPTLELTGDERAALQASSGSEYAKADALLHAACDVIAELHHGSPLDEESHVLQALLYVFVERCMRRGLDPGEELEIWFAAMDLPPISHGKIGDKRCTT